MLSPSTPSRSASRIASATTRCLLSPASTAVGVTALAVPVLFILLVLAGTGSPAVAEAAVNPTALAPAGPYQNISLLVALLFGIVFTLTDMIIIYVLTRGGPYDTTQVLASLAFFTGIQGGDLAGGAAVSLFLFPVLVAVAIVFLRLARRTEVT